MFSVSQPVASQQKEIVQEFEGHLVEKGRYSNERRNPYRLVRDTVTGEEYFEMQVETGEWFMFDIESLEKVQRVLGKNRPTWTLMQCGYISTRFEYDTFYLHAHLMGHRGEGQGNDSVDHINRNPLDNRMKNLRIASQSVQNENRGKKARAKNAKELPEGLTQENLPKFVVYYNECYHKALNKYREFFTVEHSSLTKRWMTSKSVSISIKDKLKSAIEKVFELGLGEGNKEDYIRKLENVFTTVQESVQLEPPETKECKSCKQELPLTKFGVNKVIKGGYQLSCKGCKTKEKSASTVEVKVTEKKCNKCEEVKPSECFNKRTGVDGLRNTCKQCEKERRTGNNN